MFIRVAAFRSAIVLTAASVRAFGSSASAQSSTATSFPVLATSAAQSQMAKETATVAGGCFWCIEAVYNEMAGVESAISGYIGGKNANPTYEQVCNGDTGHAEAVQITFDPSKLSYKEVLDMFFTVHDPTQMNRQGNDVGTQYRSAIFYHSDDQKKVAQECIDALGKSGQFKRSIVTELVKAGTFYTAEQYHQNYFQRNPSQPYVASVVAPKVFKARDKFGDKLKPGLKDKPRIGQ